MGLFGAKTDPGAWTLGRDIHFFVPGVARPGGSKQAFRNPHTGKMIVKEDADNRLWRNQVAAEGAKAFRRPPVDGALSVAVVFVMPRPKSHFGTGRNAGRLKPNAPLAHTKRPDTTKLFRALEDALTMVVWRDDAQIAHQDVDKVYGDTPGAHVWISSWTSSILDRVGMIPREVPHGEETQRRQEDCPGSD